MGARPILQTLPFQSRYFLAYEDVTKGLHEFEELMRANDVLPDQFASIRRDETGCHRRRNFYRLDTTP